ncbi:MAG: hypothetical protein AAFN94_13375 [Pseudomonadota bacterium]
MRRLLIICAVLAAGPASAEEDRGLSLMERGAQMLMEGLLKEIEPGLEALQELTEDLGPALQSFAAEMGPALRDLLEEVEDWSAYHPPEILDNGDIIIRRKAVPEAEPEDAPDAGGAIEL